MNINVVGNSSITDEELEKITNEIIDILIKENITHSIASVILDNVKSKLQDTLIKKCV